MYIGTKLRKLRDKRHLTHQEIADRLGVARTTVWNWENDETQFKVEHLPKLAEILEVDANDLLPDGSVVKIVNNNNNANNDNSVNAFAFEVHMDERTLSDKLLKSLESQIAFLEEKNKALANDASCDTYPQMGRGERGV